MTAETANTLSKVDSLTEETTKDMKPAKRRGSSLHADVYNMADLEKEKKEIKIAPETQKLNWKLNKSPATLEEKEMLKKPLCLPLVRKVDLHFPLGLEVTARNLKGVTIKDALDAIYKQFKKKQDDELDLPVLAGFEWDPEDCYTRFIVHQKKEGAAPPSKKKKKGGNADE
ncbi:hypothetical protein P280DRAFT_486931 [Massarina eburnea CBS 473.64]|uniref:DUF6699 domain-containing protein n=1 Tax=Massarina eburnea CBS 473.64 TaxID=1395130 RepID=A0A6A6SF13_9PLEO|nr:hypothetical protein P280DRAFT_486931 [Massarina eburnea CBS 473.64]